MSLTSPIYRYFYFALWIALAIAGWVHVQHHFIDYPVFELAGKKILEGRAADLYDLPGKEPDGFYYAYLFAFFFAPLALLGKAGRYVFLILLFLSYLKTLRFSTQSAFRQLGISQNDPGRFAFFCALILLTTYAVNDALMNANIGALLLVLCIFAFELREKQPVGSALLLAVAIVAKTYPVILLGYFIWEKRGRTVFVCVGATLFLLLGLPIVIHGPTTGMLLLSRYFYLLSHFQELWGARGWHFSGHVFQNIPATTIRLGSLFGVTEGAAYRFSMITACGLFALFYLKSFIKNAPAMSEAFREKMFALALAFVPMIVPVSWYNMALFYAPVLGFLLARALFKKDRLALSALLTYSVLYCLTTPDLIGTPLNQTLCFYAVPWLGLMGVLMLYAGQLVADYPQAFFLKSVGRRPLIPADETR